MNKFIRFIYPKHKNFEDLEQPVQNVLSGKATLGFLTVVGMVIILFIKFDWQMKLLGELLLFVYLCTVIHTWWLFLTDSVMSLEAVYTGKSEIDESDSRLIKMTSKLRHRVYSRRVFLVKDNQKFEVFVKSYDDSIAKGDVVKLYTTPNNVYEKTNGVIRINSVLALFVKESKAESETEEESEES